MVVPPLAGIPLRRFHEETAVITVINDLVFYCGLSLPCCVPRDIVGVFKESVSLDCFKQGLGVTGYPAKQQVVFVWFEGGRSLFRHSDSDLS